MNFRKTMANFQEFSDSFNVADVHRSDAIEARVQETTVSAERCFVIWGDFRFAKKEINAEPS